MSFNTNDSGSDATGASTSTPTTMLTTGNGSADGQTTTASNHGVNQLAVTSGPLPQSPDVNGSISASPLLVGAGKFTFPHQHRSPLTPSTASPTIPSTTTTTSTTTADEDDSTIITRSADVAVDAPSPFTPWLEAIQMINTFSNEVNAFAADENAQLSPYTANILNNLATNPALRSYVFESNRLIPISASEVAALKELGEQMVAACPGDELVASVARSLAETPVVNKHGRIVKKKVVKKLSPQKAAARAERLARIAHWREIARPLGVNPLLVETYWQHQRACGLHRQ